MSKHEEFKNQVANYVLGDFLQNDEVVTIEENCGSMWINLKDGTSWYVEVGKCDDEDEVEYMEGHEYPTL